MVDDRTHAQDLMTSLNAQQTELTLLLSSVNNHTVGFKLERILKIDEEQTIKEGISSIEVTDASHNQVVNFHHRYYCDKLLSTQFVERMPGLIVVNERRNEVIDCVKQINLDKDNLMAIIRRQGDKYVRHQFIHDTFPRIMTDQFRRHIHVIDKQVTNSWFNWTSRPIPQTFSIDKAISLLQVEIDNPKGLYSAKEWKAMLDIIITDLRSGVFIKVQRHKALKLLPTMVYQALDSDGVKKRYTTNANVPFLLLNQDKGLLPKYSELNNYVKKEGDKAAPLNSKKKALLNAHLKLIGVKA